MEGSTRFSHDARVGVKPKWNRETLGEPSLDYTCYLGGQIVENDVAVQLVRDSSFDLSEELFELHRSKPRVALQATISPVTVSSAAGSPVVPCRM